MGKRSIEPWLHRARGRMKLSEVLTILDRHHVIRYWTVPLGKWAIIVVNGEKRNSATTEHIDGTVCSDV